MSQVIIDEATAELKAAEQDATKLRKLIGEFERDLNTLQAGIPPTIQPNDPRFSKDFENLQKLRNDLAALKQTMLEHAKALAKSKATVQTAEKALAAEMA
jgi:DNA repair exonuclease SbcCD ATPase subunit